MRLSNVLLLTFLSLILQSCQNEPVPVDPLAHIKDAEVKEFLNQVFEASGGLENWNSKKALKYNKRFTLYKESGEEEKSAVQVHDYNYFPEKAIYIISKEESDTKKLIFEDGVISELVNEKPNAAGEEALMNKLQTSLFVISQPFKLADQGVELSYEGLDSLGSSAVHVLKATYNPATQDHHTTPDIWWLYFDKDSYLLEGYKVQHLDHISLVKNLKTKKVNGFTFPISRESYRVDSLGNILYLRASYEYEDFEILNEL